MSTTSLPAGSIQRPPTLIRDQVASYLRELIFGMSLAPGTPLIEREICEATSASRATVREAIRLLESEGLVHSVQGRGTTVATLTDTEVQELYQIRAELEGLAVRLFIDRAPTRLLRALKGSLEDLGAAVESPAEMIRVKSEFYDVLFEGAGSSELERLALGLRRRINLAQANSLSVPGRTYEAFSEVQAIVAAIERGDAREAEQLTVDHVHQAAKAVTNASEG